jgi:excinuclease Cho
MFPHHLPEGPAPHPSTLYRYPEGLREQIATAPKAPGVYTFHGEKHPLYIGKSVNIRARLLSHFREPSEARLLKQTHRISYTPTAGEISALILEARRIKEELPLYNQRLRRSRSVCSIVMQSGKVEIQSASDIDYGTTPEVFGLFKTRTAALDRLRGLADDNQLCLSLMGLERLSMGRGCFRSAIKKCAGACCGRETVADHSERLRSALQAYQIAIWPYAGPIAIKERFGDLLQHHVIDRWRYVGGYKSLQSAPRTFRKLAAFDADIYKILLRPILSGDVPITELG